MSYYAQHSGFIKLKPDTAIDLWNAIGDELHDEISEIDNENADDRLFEFSKRDSYHEEDWEEFFQKYEQYFADANIEFLGETHSIWRFRLVDGKMVEENGEIVYKEADNYRYSYLVEADSEETIFIIAYADSENDALRLLNEWIKDMGGYDETDYYTFHLTKIAHNTINCDTFCDPDKGHVVCRNERIIEVNELREKFDN